MALVLYSVTSIGISLVAGWGTVPSLSAVALSSSGPMLLHWGLSRYLRSRAGNYYYIYQCLTRTTPDDDAANPIKMGINAVSAAATFLVFTVRGGTVPPRLDLRNYSVRSTHPCACTCVL